MASDLKAAVVGTGFVGAVHVDALRHLGVEVTGVVGSTPERAAAKNLAPVYASYESLLDDDRVDVVHLATPNHLHYGEVKLALAAGKHVVCEKPLAMTSAESRELLELARESGLVHCTNFNVRFYPLVQEARAHVLARRLGELWSVHGTFLQDWLATPTDWNWRLEPDKGGTLRAVGDIGSHWLDLVQFVTGLRIVEVFADLVTAIPVRQRPAGEVETFARAADIERMETPMWTDDIAHILLHFENGISGSVVLSQVSMGSNSLRLQVDGSQGALAWDGERNKELWLGHRDVPNQTLERDPAPEDGGPASRTRLPVAYPEGLVETFCELYRAVYADVAQGGASREPDYPTFEDGHAQNVIGDAIALSNAERRWVDVTR